MASVAKQAAGLLNSVAVKPIMSTNAAEARRSVLSLYRQWYRATPTIIELFSLPYTNEKVRARIREEFVKNSHVRDVRAIDLLVIKGQMDFQETLQKWNQECHIKGFFKSETAIQEPTDFLGKFFTQK